MEKGLEEEEKKSQKSLHSTKDVNDNNSLHDSLHSFVFIKATKDEITELTD